MTSRFEPIFHQRSTSNNLRVCTFLCNMQMNEKIAYDMFEHTESVRHLACGRRHPEGRTPKLHSSEGPTYGEKSLFLLLCIK